MCRFKRRGFTLIELLIVVAIIAILAAIAVPNFLEAQVRAKVSRVKADARSMATAVEAYTVDNNRPPLCWAWRYDLAYVTTHGSAGPGDTFKYISLLTTPVAYMSTVPLDPFVTQGAKYNAGGTNEGAITMNYKYLAYNEYVSNWVAWDSSTSLENMESVRCRNMGYRWAIASRSPMRYADIRPQRSLLKRMTGFDVSRPMIPPYDPTNGTVSDGLVMRTNRGDWNETWGGDPEHP